MRKLLGIIEDDTPPQTCYLWLYKGVIKYFRNGKWVVAGGGDATEVEEILNTPV